MTKKNSNKFNEVCMNNCNNCPWSDLKAACPGQMEDSEVEEAAELEAIIEDLTFDMD